MNEGKRAYEKEKEKAKAEGVGELDNLILQIVKLASNPTYKDHFPIRALVEDKKLFPLVSELRHDLDEGFSKILYK